MAKGQFGALVGVCAMLIRAMLILYGLAMAVIVVLHTLAALEAARERTG